MVLARLRRVQTYSTTSTFFDHEKAEVARINEETKAIKERRLAIEAELRGTPLKVPHIVRKEVYKLSERKRIATERNVAEAEKTSRAEAKLAYKVSAAAAKKSMSVMAC